MLRLTSSLVFGLILLASVPDAKATSSTSQANSGADSAPILVQQPTGGSESSIASRLDEVAQLRKQIAALYGGPHEMAAAPLLAHEFALGEQIIRTARTGATDAQMHALIDYLNVDGDVLFSMIARRPSDTDLVKLGLSYATARRARFAREQFQESFAWKTSVAHEHPDLWHSLRQAQNRFSDLSILPSFLGHPRPDLIEQQAAVIEDLEKRIAGSGGLSRDFQMNTTSDILSDMGVDQLIANVNFGKVLIVYVAYDQLIRQVKNGLILRGPSRYLAIVGHADAPLAAVDLGPASEIEPLVGAFLSTLALKKAPPSGAVYDKDPAQRLFRVIIAPLRGYFKYQGVDYGKTLLIVPDAALLTIPFAALVDGGTFMIGEYGLQLLDSPGEANLFSRSNLDPSTRLVAFANPDLPTTAHGLQRLSEADREAAQIASLWPQGQNDIFGHAAATPEALEARATAAGVLHIASHGVFAATVVGPTDPRTLTPQNISADRTGLMASSLSRSAFILAPAANGSSGFFSALAVLSLDLSHTQLVVLSACDSGRGDRERGEGIYGLRRSFLSAGAETVVSSLWSVDSTGTREFMVSFYRNLFQGEGRAVALQHAAAFTRLTYPHPYYWAAFVITGNVGGLRLPPAN
jgi:CHAT domain-containing protein